MNCDGTPRPQFLNLNEIINDPYGCASRKQHSYHHPRRWIARLRIESHSDENRKDVIYDGVNESLIVCAVVNVHENLLANGPELSCGDEPQRNVAIPRVVSPVRL